MKALISLFAVWLAFAAGTIAAAAEEGFDDPALEARYQALTHEIRCPKCLNESIAESKAPVAADLKREVRRLIGEGKSDDEVKTFLSERYGEFVLYRPRLETTTWLLWLGPVLLLLGGGFVVSRIVRKRTSRTPVDDDANQEW
jgi:cytochrome c-type biogenesis protein CcmH